MTWLGIHTSTIGRIFSLGYLLKTISINCSTSNLPEEVIKFGASKNWPKKIKMGIWWMKCTWKYLDSFNIFWEIKKNLNKHKLMHKLIYTIWSLIKHNAKQKQKKRKICMSEKYKFKYRYKQGPILSNSFGGWDVTECMALVPSAIQTWELEPQFLPLTSSQLLPSKVKDKTVPHYVPRNSMVIMPSPLSLLNNCSTIYKNIHTYIYSYFPAEDNGANIREWPTDEKR